MLRTKVGAWYAAVDYVRMTWRPQWDYGSLVHDLSKLCLVAGKGSSSEVVRAEPAAILQYHGWRWGKCFLGEAEQGLMLQASGLSAQYIIEARLTPDNISRLDLQVTVWMTEDTPNVAVDVARDAVEARERARGRRVAVRLIEGFGAGDTAYIGTRGKKAKFLRVYDKWRESGDSEYMNAWRWECELTDVHAVMAYWNIADTGNGPELIRRLVAGYFAERGLWVPGEDAGPALEPWRLPKDIGSDERRLRWLAAQVAPAIEKMLARGVDMADIKRALGLES